MAPANRLPADHASRLGSEPEQGYYDENPGADISLKQMTLNEPENSKGLRFGNFVQIRDIISEEMEAVMTGNKSGQSGRCGSRARQPTTARL